MTTTIRKHRTLNLTATEVRAMLAGRKLAHVLPVKPQPPSREWFLKRSGQDCGFYSAADNDYRMCGAVGVARDEMGEAWPKDHYWHCPLGQPGDEVLCRETWSFEPPRDVDYPLRVTYRIDKHVAKIDPDSVQWEGLRENGPGENWRPVNTMPSWAVRLRPIIESVAVKRTSEITEDEAAATGITLKAIDCRPGHAYREMLAEAWNARYAKPSLSWKSNPWLWLVKWRLPT